LSPTYRIGDATMRRLANEGVEMGLLDRLGLNRPGGAATVGMIFLGDAVSPLKLVSIGLILAGVIGLNLSGVTPVTAPPPGQEERNA